ncbi:DsrE family protein [Hydrogenophaga sp.]|uniref:DsrE family protein n=1 Tax=Hydrogenophaga sp. TaxID=1904254 RepID=UPI003566D070
MNRKSFLQAASLLLLMPLAMGASAQSTAKPRVVFQVSDDDAGKWNLALNNAKNVQQAYGADKVDVEIVAYGPGIGMFKADSSAANRVAEASKAGVKMAACQNTMRGQKLTEADMNTAVGYVPSGVVALMQRQSEGWTYIRP